jgi:hypothetical protein
MRTPRAPLHQCRLVERFLLDDYRPHQLSTYAVTLFRHTHRTPEGEAVPVGEPQLAVCRAG